MKLFSAVLAGLMLVGTLAISNAKATVIYEQGPSGTKNTNAATSDGKAFNSNFERTAFDDFRLSSASTVTSLTWMGKVFPSTTFEIGFYAHSGSRPASTPLFQITLDPVITQDSDFSFVYHYEADLGAGLFLEADTRYWLSITDVSDDLRVWGWLADQGGSSLSRNNNGVFSNSNLNLFFSLNSNPVAVPEPATLSLFGLGLIGLSAAGLRRRNSMASRMSARDHFRCI
ncbi:PEP-CTERM sorting domain-containing protein [Denitrobaculum tricleocarpae]|uniref:PEP-CTERM sorting domain-containing protein n=2 Tax=Denitrobaculum tricleocarpae TaxID=2591009 RepID=A0A545TPV5_9PROT|nr:PEP-CTERM sorting domain-containing protein [Denitrobaculum tricleocarpae]